MSNKVHGMCIKDLWAVKQRPWDVNIVLMGFMTRAMGCYIRTYGLYNKDHGLYIKAHGLSYKDHEE